jgi:hypothetical protein
VKGPSGTSRSDQVGQQDSRHAGDWRAAAEAELESGNAVPTILIILGLFAIVFCVFDSANPNRPLLLVIGVCLASIGAGLRSTEAIAQRLERIEPGTGSRFARRAALVVGVLLFVANILPEYRQNFGAGGGYYWPGDASLFAAVGVALVVLAVLTKPKDEPF